MVQKLSFAASACLVLWSGGALATTPADERDEKLVLTMSAAVDTDCDGSLGDESDENAAFDAAKILRPGQCIVYRTIYRNDGDFALRKVEVRTPVPQYMVYVGGTAQHVETPPGLMAKAPRAPEDGGEGELVWQFSGGLGPGEAGRVEFRVKLVP